MAAKEMPIDLPDITSEKDGWLGTLYRRKQQSESDSETSIISLSNSSKPSTK